MVYNGIDYYAPAVPKQIVRMMRAASTAMTQICDAMAQVNTILEHLPGSPARDALSKALSFMGHLKITSKGHAWQPEQQLPQTFWLRCLSRSLSRRVRRPKWHINVPRLRWKWHLLKRRNMKLMRSLRSVRRPTRKVLRRLHPGVQHLRKISVCVAKSSLTTYYCKGTCRTYISIRTVGSVHIAGTH